MRPWKSSTARKIVTSWYQYRWHRTCVRYRYRIPHYSIALPFKPTLRFFPLHVTPISFYVALQAAVNFTREVIESWVGTVPVSVVTHGRYLSRKIRQGRNCANFWWKSTVSGDRWRMKLILWSVSINTKESFSVIRFVINKFLILQSNVKQKTKSKTKNIRLETRDYKFSNKFGFYYSYSIFFGNWRLPSSSLDFYQRNCRAAVLCWTTDGLLPRPIVSQR